LVIAFGLDDDIVYVGLGVSSDLPLEAFLDSFLIGSTCVLEAEHHGVIAVGSEGRDEGGHLLIRLL